jgi:5-methylthioadenosine/S-adenosylhomocysteine deaminase
MKIRAINKFICIAAFIVFSTIAIGQKRENADLLIRGGTIVTMDAQERVLENAAIAVRGDQILAVGPIVEITKLYRPSKTIDAAGKLILPGLINTHNHAPMVLFRGIADDLALMDWLTGYIFPAEARNVNADFVRWGTLLACAEMIRSGTTTYADMYYFEDTLAEATRQAGMRAVLGETILDFPSPDHKTPQEALAYTERFIKKWKGDPLIHPAVAPHAPYTVATEILKACAALAGRYDVPLITHISETQDEQRQIREKYGKTPTRFLDDLGVLSARVLAAHCVWIDDQDLEILVRRQVGLAHNPESNMKLASGAAPIVKMLKAGARLGLGTDGAASNNDLNMFEAMDLASKLQKFHLADPTALPAREVVRMATSSGARALHMEKEIGSLEAGKKADIIIMDTDQAHLLPRYDVYSHLVYAYKGSDVLTTIIGGQVVFDKERTLTLDESQIRAKAREYKTRILASLGKNPG